MRIEAETVPGWAPTVHVSDAVTERDRPSAFAERIASAYEAPPIAYSAPQGALVTGARWVAITEAEGLVRSTTFLIPRFTWLDAFRQLSQPAPLRHWTSPMLVCGTRAHDNHFHWLFQSLATAIIARNLGLDPATPLVMPPLNDRQLASLALCGIDNPIETLPDNALAIMTDAILSTACSGDHGMNPHPAMMMALRDEARRLTGMPRRWRKLYLSRRDAANKRLPVNDDEVSAALVEQGFEVVAGGELPLDAQMRLIREAAIVVAPHGAALSNLCWAEHGTDGPMVIELFQENFTNRCFARLCQSKGLAYHAIVSECAVRAELLIDTRGRIDLPLLLSLLDRLPPLN